MYDDVRTLSDPATPVNSITGLADGTLPEFDGPDDASITRMWASADGGDTGTWIVTSSLHKSAATGDFADLDNVPAIPASAADVGAVPTTRKVNGKALSGDVTLAATDVGAATPADLAGKQDKSSLESDVAGKVGGTGPLGVALNTAYASRG